MKFGKSAARYAFVVLFGACAFVTAQNSNPPAPKQQQPSNGKVIFSRSVDANGQTVTETAPQPVLAKAPIATDAQREAVTFTAYDLDVHLRTAAHGIAARALLTVRNDGKTPLPLIPLEISSTLNWQVVRVAGPNGNQDAAFEVATLNSDADHTGQLHEAAVKLAEPLAPGATLKLDVEYAGTIEPSAQRLLALGTPDDVAAHSDWDGIDTAFTGLRGFGNVAWYPVAAPPVILGDGARLFDEIGEQMQRMSAASFRLRLTVEFPHGQAPTIALVNGHAIPLKVTDWPTAGEDVPGVATGEFTQAAMGFAVPSIFAAIRNKHDGANMAVWTRSEDDVNASSWTEAEKIVTPSLQQWLGQRPRAPLTILDLPDAADTPFETGPMLVTGIQDGDPEQLKAILAHSLTHAWFSSPRAWLNEGVAFFMGTLWAEQEQGREKALGILEAGRAALALAEPSSPGVGAGQPLGVASTPAYYRTKAAYVLWMLRGITSDDALGAALRGYDPARDTSTQQPSELETLLERASGSNLHWFFADWVDADHGLPDFTIANVYSVPEKSGNWLVAVRVNNAGYAAAQVPVIVRAGETTITQRVIVPAQGSVTPRILIQGRPTQVQVNDGTVPEVGASEHVTDVDIKGAVPAQKPQ